MVFGNVKILQYLQQFWHILAHHGSKPDNVFFRKVTVLKYLYHVDVKRSSSTHQHLGTTVSLSQFLCHQCLVQSAMDDFFTISITAAWHCCGRFLSGEKEKRTCSLFQSSHSKEVWGEKKTTTHTHTKLSLFQSYNWKEVRNMFIPWVFWINRGDSLLFRFHFHFNFITQEIWVALPG